MNTTVKQSPIDIFRGEVLPPERAADLYRSLAVHIRPEVFERNLTNCLMANPGLLKFDPRLVYREVSKAAGLGLLLDPQLGEAYIVVSYNYKTKAQEPQLRIGYKGMNKLARQTGGVTTIRAHEICANDNVEVDFGFPKMLHIRPRNLFAERGDAIGYVAVIEFKDGSFDFDAMSVEQCRAIRDRSDAWKAYAEKKIKSTPWSTDEAEMAKKTVLRRLLKRQDQSPELRQAIAIEDEAEMPTLREVRDVTPPVPKRPPPPDDEEPAGERMTEEELLAGLQDLGVGPPPEGGKPPTGAASVPDAARTAAAARRPPPPDDTQTAPPEDPEAVLRWIDQQLALGMDGGALEAIYNTVVEPSDGFKSLLPPDQEEAQGILRKHMRRVEP